MSNLWLIRSIRGNRNFADHCIYGGYIAIEWGNKAIEWNEKLQRRIRLERWFDECYPENHSIKKRNLIIEDMKLFLSIKPEDYVITPSGDNLAFYYAKVTENSDYYFSKDEDDDCPKHRRKVQWEKKMFDRRNFLNRFGVQYHQQKKIYKIEISLQEFEAYLHEVHLIDVPYFRNKTSVIDRSFNTVPRASLIENQEGRSLGPVAQRTSRVRRASPSESQEERGLGRGARHISQVRRASPSGNEEEHGPGRGARHISQVRRASPGESQEERDPGRGTRHIDRVRRRASPSGSQEEHGPGRGARHISQVRRASPGESQEERDPGRGTRHIDRVRRASPSGSQEERDPSRGARHISQVQRASLGESQEERGLGRGTRHIDRVRRASPGESQEERDPGRGARHISQVRRARPSGNEEERGLGRGAQQHINRIQSPDENEDESGLEKEKVDEEEDLPSFPPEKIRIRPPTFLLVDQLITRVAHKEIDLEPDFQRLRGIWKNAEKSRLIESLMLRIPIPVFYVSADQEDNWSVVDGVQRMSTICDFINNKFPLMNLEYMKQYDDFLYEDLPRSLQRRISETSLMVNVIEPSTPSEVMFNIFTRINTGGTQLNAQEIRHALNAGAVREFLKTLANSCEFKNATDNSVRPLRMADRECVLRFLAFCITPPEEYSASKFDDFLMEAMKKINQLSSSQRTALAEDFKKAMRAACDIFGGQNAFRKLEPRRYAINKALFETWGVQLACCSQTKIDKLIQKRQDVQKRFADRLKQDVEFDDSISHSTSNTNRIRKRFRTVEEIVKEVVDAF